MNSKRDISALEDTLDNGGQRLGIVERTRIWEENKQKRIENLKDQLGDKDLVECTFQPQMPSQPVRSSTSTGTASAGQTQSTKSLKAMQKYVNRMNGARQQVIEKQTY